MATTAEATEITVTEEPKLKPVDYKSDLKPIWCPGCGDYATLSAIHQSLARLGVPTHMVAVISGIGCSSRIPGYCATYGFNTIHGRALPIATGVKMANPELTVIAAGGDGDGLSIGGGHFPHAGRRNVDMTYIMMDNNIYGLTKGQVSPTTPAGDTTKSSPYGLGDRPLDAIQLALAYNVSYVARGFSGNIKHLVEMIYGGLSHKGFSFIHVASPCPTYRGIDRFKEYKERVVYLDDDHDATNPLTAYQAALRDDGKVPLGVFFKQERPTLTDNCEAISRKALANGQPTIEGIMDQFIP